ncbi:hypothetical protein PROFUN_10314 [Planoprotostelium fungivorum]|uniref:Uncharacterized protein n=1 Tax=Planoprotostelium fungivorum TaxID=1890364 RepID=A0A2P6NDR2_9EUKA|nr:hypothetical protein PROFUN_10314 [Planoprotostelium fungivorum]
MLPKRISLTYCGKCRTGSFQMIILLSLWDNGLINGHLLKSKTPSKIDQVLPIATKEAIQCITRQDFRLHSQAKISMESLKLSLGLGILKSNLCKNDGNTSEMLYKLILERLQPFIFVAQYLSSAIQF